MTMQLIETERGQALFEAVFIMMLLVTLLFAIQFTGQLRASSLAVLGESSYATFIKSNINGEDNQAGMQHSHKHAGLLSTFSQQLLVLDGQGLIQVQRSNRLSPESRKIANLLFKEIPIARTSYLYINAGNSLTSSEVQSRIADSTAAWSDTAQPTQTMLKPHISLLEKIDKPWRRGVLSTDWLSKWAKQSPSDNRLGRLK